MNNLIFFIILALLSLPAHAGLQWFALTVEPRVSIDTERVEAVFAFVNEGEEPITLTSMKTSCGCTVARVQLFELGEGPDAGSGAWVPGAGEEDSEPPTPDTIDQPSNIPLPAFPLTVQPGQRGELTAVLTLGSRTGRQVKSVVVRTDSPTRPVTTLTLKATIPVWLKVRPRLVYWSPDEPAATKRVVLEAEDDRPMTILSVTPETPAVTAELETIEEGQRYAVLITPTEPRAPGITKLQIQTTPAPGSLSETTEAENEAGEPVVTDDAHTDPPIKTYTVTARVMGGAKAAAVDAAEPVAASATP